MGTDKIPKTTDYQNRFAHTQTNFQSVQSSPYDESKKNKAKMTSDSIVIAGNDIQLNLVSSKLQFQDTSKSSR